MRVYFLINLHGDNLLQGFELSYAFLPTVREKRGKFQTYTKSAIATRSNIFFPSRRPFLQYVFQVHFKPLCTVCFVSARAHARTLRSRARAHATAAEFSSPREEVNTGVERKHQKLSLDSWAPELRERRSAVFFWCLVVNFWCILTFYQAFWQFLNHFWQWSWYQKCFSACWRKKWLKGEIYKGKNQCFINQF